jgi:hypothetical protein
MSDHNSTRLLAIKIFYKRSVFVGYQLNILSNMTRERFQLFIMFILSKSLCLSGGNSTSENGEHVLCR